MDQIREKRKSVLCINMKDAGYWLLLVFLTLPHMKPEYLARFPAVDIIFDVLRGTSFLAIVFWYVIKRKPVSLVIILVAVWQVFLVYSTLMHKGEVYNCLVGAFSILSVMLLYDAAYNNKKQVFLSAQLFCFELIIYVNLLTELLFPNGMYVRESFPYSPNWFLGYYNGYSVWFVPGLMFAWLYREKTGKSMRTYLFTAGVIVSIIQVFAGGETVSVACMVLVFAFFKNRTRFFNYMNYWLLHVYFIILVFVFRIQNMFTWLLDDILGKMGSFLSRLDAWEKTLVLLKQSPIIGFGIKDSATRLAEYHSTWMIHSHNQLLELLYRGGIIGFTLFGLIVFLSGRKLMKYGYTMESKIISTAFLGWCVATLVEPFTSPFLMGMFVIAHRSNRSERMGNVGEHLPEVVR